jgi:hypothetical protein
MSTYESTRRQNPEEQYFHTLVFTTTHFLRIYFCAFSNTLTLGFHFYEDLVLRDELYRVSTKELYTFKIMQKTNAMFLKLHTYTSRYKNTQSFVLNDPGDCCCCVPPLNATSFENGYSTTEELVYSAVSEERVCNSCETCISHTISHGTTQPSIHLHLVQEILSEKVHLHSSRGTLCTKFWTSWIIVSTSAV